MSLPQKLPLELMQTQWAAQLDPILNKQLLKGNILTEVFLSSGNNVINHLLSRMPQGWIITDQNSSASIYRSASFNVKTITLFSDADVTVNLYVF